MADVVQLPNLDPIAVERRIQARLAWNGWPDSDNARKEIAAHEAKDPLSAVAWDRVVASIMKGALIDVIRAVTSGSKSSGSK